MRKCVLWLFLLRMPTAWPIVEISRLQQITHLCWVTHTYTHIQAGSEAVCVRTQRRRQPQIVEIVCGARAFDQPRFGCVELRQGGGGGEEEREREREEIERDGARAR